MWCADDACCGAAVAVWQGKVGLCRFRCHSYWHIWLLACMCMWSVQRSCPHSAAVCLYLPHVVGCAIQTVVLCNSHICECFNMEGAKDTHTTMKWPVLLPNMCTGSADAGCLFKPVVLRSLCYSYCGYCVALEPAAARALYGLHAAPYVSLH
jgi:hypothetical protein